VRILLAVTAVVSVFASLLIHWNPSRLGNLDEHSDQGSELWLSRADATVVVMLVSSPKKDRMLLMLTVAWACSLPEKLSASLYVSWRIFTAARGRS